jgi:hypothetical protein
MQEINPVKFHDAWRAVVAAKWVLPPFFHSLVYKRFACVEVFLFPAVLELAAPRA